jgi:DNA-directed RNA polymerase subunit alpha
MLVANKIETGTIVLEPSYGRFFISNLPYGMGVTIGNTLRRVLLSHIMGAAIFYVKINNALHEYETIPGVKEDIMDIIINLKEVNFVYKSSSEYERVYLNVKGPAEVRASDIKCPALVSVVNPDKYIATITTNTVLNIEAGVKKGIGYVPAEDQVLPEETIGYIKVDSIFSPIKKVNYYVENERNEENQLTDKLYIEIFTDGSVFPKDALVNSLSIVKLFLEDILRGYSADVSASFPTFEKDSVNSNYANKSIKELELSSRTVNSLKRIGINTIGDLLKYTKDDLTTVRNLGEKSIMEIQEKLEAIGLKLRES